MRGERCRNGVKELKFVVQHPENIWRREIQTHDNIGTQRQRMDPHERRSVYIGNSTIPGAGEGIIAKRSFQPTDLISYFGGLKTVRENFLFKNMTVSELEDAGSYFYNFGFNCPPHWNINRDLVIDTPNPYRSIVQYRTTLGHKVNHAFPMKKIKKYQMEQNISKLASNFRVENARDIPCIHPFLGKLICLIAGMCFVILFRLIILLYIKMFNWLLLKSSNLFVLISSQPDGASLRYFKQ